MSYIGTGTVDDPYIVSTITEFVNCVGISGAYVKVIKDIYSEEDPEYNGELLNPITFNCLKVYADERKVINGIIVTSAHFAVSPTDEYSTCSIEKLNFTNCTHNKFTTSSGASVTVFSNGNSNSNIKFYDCVLSMKINQGAFAPYINDSSWGFERCSLTFEFSGTNDYSTLSITNCTECSIYIKGGRFSSSGYEILSSSIRTGVVAEDTFFTVSGVGGNMIRNCHFSYVALVNPIISYQSAVRCRATNCGSCFLAVDDSLFIIAPDSVGLTILSLSQMKDEEYLSNVGFLP